MHDRRRKPRKVRTLVVDERIDEARKLSQLLEAMGCETAIAYGGASGIQMGKAFRPHLAIVDVHALEADGSALVERLARELPMKPILVAYPGTGPLGPALERRLATAGVDRIIPAPMDPTLLADVLQECQRWWGSSWTRGKAGAAG